MATESELPNGSQEYPASLRIEGGLTVYTVQELRGQMLERLAAASRLDIDLGAVDACDCAGLQLLCAARKSAFGQGKAFEVVNASQAVRDAAEAIGLSASEYSKPLQRV